MTNKKEITILTAVKNGDAVILGLIESLNKQKNNNFKWLIIDGSSTDNTRFIIESNTKIEYKIITTNDFSIYHAFNIAIDHIDTRYYVTAGADDKFAENFSELVADLVKSEEFDLILGEVQTETKKLSPKLQRAWFFGSDAPHSIGTIINCSLHKQFGKYSNLYPIVADRYFLKQAIKGNVKCTIVPHIFGYYSLEGMSSRLKYDSICDLFRMQIATNEAFIIQLLLLLLRLIKAKFTK